MQPPLRCAVFLNGTLNDPAKPRHWWSVEIAFPIDKLLYNTSGPRPDPSVFWRFQMSRVEWGTKVVTEDGVEKYWKEPSCLTCPRKGVPQEDNWVYQKMGVIDVHLPEDWAILQFSDDEPGTTPLRKDPSFPARATCRQVYNAQMAYQKLHKGFSDSIAELTKLAQEPSLLSGQCTSVPKLTRVSNTTFTATVVDKNITVSVDETRLYTQI